MSETVRPLREGFVRPVEDVVEHMEPLETPSGAPPRDPLPPEMKLTEHPPEPPIDPYEEVRRDIADRAEKWPITVQLLYRPIRDVDGKELTALTFREPRAAEINRIGNPTRVLWDSEIVVEERKMTFIMASLSGILPPILEQMDPRDWNSCALRLRKFFIADLRAW
jgi:hypothetical protein